MTTTRSPRRGRSSRWKLRRLLAGLLIPGVLLPVAAAPACSQTSPHAAGTDTDEVRLEIDDGTAWHVHPAGARFRVEVTRRGATAATVLARWVDADQRPLGEPLRVPAGLPTTLTSPSDRIGYYGLVFESPTESVSFPPQIAGQPSATFGFAILPPPPADEPLPADFRTPFGLVHADVRPTAAAPDAFDPHLRGVHSKTLTWNTVDSTDWAAAIATRRRGGLIELPILSDEGWDTDGHRPVSKAALDALRARFANLARTAEVDDWELGVEENYENRYGREPYYLANLAAKAATVRQGLRAARPHGRIVYNLEGFDYIDWERLADSEAMASIDVLSTHPYRWPDFEPPETWLGEHLDRLHEILDARKLSDRPLWITEGGTAGARQQRSGRILRLSGRWQRSPRRQSGLRCALPGEIPRRRARARGRTSLRLQLPKPRR